MVPSRVPTIPCMALSYRSLCWPKMVGMARTHGAAGKLTPEALYEYALRALGRRSHTFAELERKLARKCASREDIADVVARLLEYGYLDDERVAESHTELRRDAALLGSKRVLGELRRRGIDQATAERVVHESYEQADEVQLAQKHLRRKLGGATDGPRIGSRKDVVRVFRSLLRAGFSAAVVAEVLREAVEDAEWVEHLADAATQAEQE